MIENRVPGALRIPPGEMGLSNLGSHFGVQNALKNRSKKTCQKYRIWDVKMSPKWRPKGATIEVKVVQNQLKNTARFYVSKNEDF